MVKSFIKKSKEVFEICKDECLENEDMDINVDDKNIVQKISDFADKLVDSNGISLLKPCQIQSYLLKYISNIDELFVNYQELLNGLR